VKALDGLIRLGRWKLDGERKRLAALEAQVAGYANQIRRLEGELQSEAAFAAESVDAAMNYSRYLSTNVAARRNLSRSIADLEPQIESARKAIADAFRELKAYELIAENRRQAERKAGRRKEQARLDEIGIDVHRRQNASPASGDDRLDDVTDGIGSQWIGERGAGSESDASLEPGDAAAVLEDRAHSVAVGRGERSVGPDDQFESFADDQPVELKRPKPARLDGDEEPSGGG
jgi:flagellar export protein FliJ